MYKSLGPWSVLDKGLPGFHSTKQSKYKSRYSSQQQSRWQ